MTFSSTAASGAKRHGVLELEGGRLADDRRLGLDRADERACRRPDVARHRDRQSRLAVNVPDQLDRGRLAVRPRDGYELVREHPPGQLELAQDRQAAAARGDDHGACAGRPGS